MNKSLLVMLLSLNLMGCMIDDQTNELEEAEVSDMMESGTLKMDTSKELFTLTGTRSKRSLHVKINPVGTFLYIIQQADLTVNVRDYPVKKRSNESFEVELPKDLQDEKLEIKVFIRSGQPIYLNDKRYDDSTTAILLKKQVIDWEITN